MIEPRLITDLTDCTENVSREGLPTVVISSRSFSTGDRDLVGELAAAGLRAVRVAAGHHRDELLPALRTAVGWIAGTSPISGAELAAAPSLRVLARYGVGVESVDLQAAEQAGVIVTNTPGANSEAVSEHTVALIFAALRGVAAGDARIRQGSWSVSRGRQLSGSVAGVIGFGRIGRGTAERLASLGCRLLVHDPFVDPATMTDAGVEPVELDELRRRADVVALHAPGGSLIVDALWLADCRPGQVIVNTARADLVDEAELARAVADGRVFAYAADTLRTETDAEHSSPLLDPALNGRVTITPHLGAQTVQAVDAMGAMAVADVLAVLAGETPAHPVRAGAGGIQKVSGGSRSTEPGTAEPGTAEPGTAEARTIEARTTGPRTMRFIGANTGSSSILKLFPVWSSMLGLNAELTGLDIPIGAPAQVFRDTLRRMRADELCAGALVTTHKISLYEAAHDLFDEIDPFGAECGEISCIAIRDGRLVGSAKDPITAGLAIEEFLSDGHFAGGGHVVCFGAGGAGTAIGWYLTQRRDAPGQMTFLDTSPERLRHLMSVITPHADRTELRAISPAEVDVPELLGALPPGSLVINATGLGKERPGSPLPASGVFPSGALVWELNYRGSLEFLQQARQQQQSRHLTVIDGWRYFIHGWTQVISDVFGVAMPIDQVQDLARVAQELR